jgi:hypothetical protein
MARGGTPLEGHYGVWTHRRGDPPARPVVIAFCVSNAAKGAGGPFPTGRGNTTRAG